MTHLVEFPLPIIFYFSATHWTSVWLVNWDSIHSTLQVVYEKIYFEAHTNNQYIGHKNNTVQLYFIIGTAKLPWIFSSLLKDHFNFHRFSNRKWVLTMCTIENL